MKKKVLIVEDDLATRRGLAELLSNEGYDTTAVGSFQDAIRAALIAEPDLLITDIRLHDYNGLQLVMRLAHVPAIVITGHPDRVLEQEAARAGATFVVKPLRATELLQLVKRKLEDGHDPSASESHS